MTCIVRGPDDLISLVPYLIGFHPEESLVVWLSDGRVRLTARMDLGAVREGPELRTLFQRMHTSSQGEMCFVVAYSQDLDAARTALTCARDVAPVDVIDACACDGTRWWSVHCDDPDCCPPDGVLIDAAGSPAVAEAVGAGLAPLDSRASLAAQVRGPEPSPGLERAATSAVRRVTAMRPGRRTGRLAELLDDRLQEPGESALPDTAHEMAALLLDPGARDVAWAALAPGVARKLVAIWRDVVEQVDESLAVGPLCQLGMAAWVGGDGGLMSVCLERAERLMPDYPPVRLMSDIVTSAASPDLWLTVVPTAS